MVIPAEYAVLTVALWLAVAAAAGIYALVSAMRRQTLLMTPVAVAFSMTVGSLWLFPSTYMNDPAIVILKLFAIFIVIDLIVVSLILKFKRTR